MDAPLRKKVTRVGSGAFSIYLPKKWIDAWTPEQQAGREVELRHISDSMLITPVQSAVDYEGKVPDACDAVRLYLISAYVKGFHQVRLTSLAGTFSNECIADARDLLRHLDERIVAHCDRDAIGFHLRSDLPASIARGEDLLGVLAAKVQEVLRMANDAVGSYTHDPDRALHALGLLRSTHDEDVSRLFYQATRMVATLEIPLESVSVYQLVGLTAAEYHRMSEQALEMAQTILEAYGLTMTDLDYPRAHLLKQMESPPRQGEVGRDIIHAVQEAFTGIHDAIGALDKALIERDVAALVDLEGTSRRLRDRLQKGVFVAVSEHWGADVEVAQAMAAFSASKHATSLAHALEHVRSIARHGMALLAAETA